MFNWRSVFASRGVARRMGQVDQIRNCLRNRVADCWLPETVVFTDCFPHTATGKVQKSKLSCRSSTGTMVPSEKIGIVPLDVEVGRQALPTLSR
jgi:hypothetical protein